MMINTSQMVKIAELKTQFNLNKQDFNSILINSYGVTNILWLNYNLANDFIVRLENQFKQSFLTKLKKLLMV